MSAERTTDILILAAGYATRLYPLTRNRPKPLLEVAGRPMIDRILAALAPTQNRGAVCVVANAKFFPHFTEWAERRRRRDPDLRILVLNDGSTDDSNKLGAIGDIHFALQKAKPQGDLIVAAGDNLFSKPLEGFDRFAREKGGAAVGVYDVGSLELAKKYNEIQLDPEGRIVRFEEKPQNPQSSLCAVALYYYPQEVFPLIRRYIAEGENPDQPGRLVQWLCPRFPVYAWQVPGKWYDIGSKESLEEADRVFKKLDSAPA